MRIILEASRHKENETLQQEAADAKMRAKNAIVFRQAAESLSDIKLKKANQDVNKRQPNVPDEQLVPPELRERSPAPEDEIEGNPLNCCEWRGV